MRHTAVFVVTLVLTLSLILAAETGEPFRGELTVGSGGGVIVVEGPGSTGAFCGNDVIDVLIGEQCDGTNLGANTCLDYGYTGGTLSCQSSCNLDFSACTSTSGSTTPSGGSSGSSRRSSSSSSTEKCDSNWVCGEWSSCFGGTQSRTCSTECGVESAKPAEERSCGEGTILEEEQGPFMSFITGAVTGIRETPEVYLLILITIGLVGGLLYTGYKRRGEYSD